jgi:cytochrome b561
MNTHYTAPAKVLHWLMAILIGGLLGLGFYMADLPLSPEKIQLFSWHKWAGVTVFMLVWVRLFWRLVYRPPAYPDSMTALRKAVAHAGHFALYALMIAIPISGWLMSSAKGVQTVWFGVLPLPDLLSRDKALGHQLEELHSALAVGLMALVAIHVAAAVYHYRVLKDDILQRMLPAKASH